MKAQTNSEHSVGDVIRHLVTGQQGRIVRTVKVADILQAADADQRQEFAYIVALPPRPFSPAREALWLPSEVDRNGAAPDAGEPLAPVAPPQICWICDKEVLPADRWMDDFGKPVHIACLTYDSIRINAGPD